MHNVMEARQDADAKAMEGIGGVLKAQKTEEEMEKEGREIRRKREEERKEEDVRADSYP